MGDDNECEANDGISSYIQSLYECPYGDRGVTNLDYIKQLKCGVSLPEPDDLEARVCDLIENRWKWSTTCKCREYQILEKLYGDSDYENELRSQLQDSFDTTYAYLEEILEAWNQEYQCDKTFECDIYADFVIEQPIITEEPSMDPTTDKQSEKPTTAQPTAMLATDDPTSAMNLEQSTTEANSSTASPSAFDLDCKLIKLILFLIFVLFI